MTFKLPSLFIGSSVEGLSTAYAIQQALDYDAEPVVWSQGIFQPSQTVLSELVKNLPTFEFAVFVFSPDDTINLRGIDHRAVRDNVIFELGLFIGALGANRCFYLVPRNIESLHLPSDLAGITPLTYNSTRSDQNLLAALGPACNEIRNAIKRQREIKIASSITMPAKEGRLQPESASEKLQRYINLWNGDVLRKDRDLVREKGVPMSGYEVDDDNEAEWDAFGRLFYFFGSVSAAVIQGEIDSALAKKEFGEPLVSVWNHARLAFPAPNHVDDWWEPLPPIGQVSLLWQKS